MYSDIWSPKVLFSIFQILCVDYVQVVSLAICHQSREINHQHELWAAAFRKSS